MSPLLEHEKVNILLVDDRPDKLLALEMVLAELNENVLKASSGADALRLLLKHDVAVILLDVNMPQMDGFETASLIRQRKNFEHTPIIFITSINVNDNQVAQGYSLGAVDYIFTPIVPEILKTKVAVFIELYRRREQVRRQGEAAEKRAAGLETRLQDLLNRLNLGIFSCTPDGQLLEANRAFFRILGIDHLEKTPPLILERFVSLSRGSSRFAALSQGGDAEPASKNEEQLEVRMPDGSARWYSLTTSVSRSTDKVVEGLLEDISIRKAAEEALKEADRRKDRFLAILSHELRNPLAALQSAIQLNQRANGSNGERWTQEILERQIKHLGRLIDDLLDISRINQDKIDLQLEELDIGAIIRRAIDVVRPLIEVHQHRLHVNVAPELYIRGDTTRIEQVIVNLLQNAAKYTGPGGEIFVSAERRADEVSIEISDSGVGITPEMLPKVFEFFMQSDNSLDRSQGGLGIGLTLVKRLVELHGGGVSAFSAGLGSGSRFSVSFPALDEPTIPDAPSAAVSTSPMITGRILVVDDNRDSALLTAELLKLSGYTVITAHDGISALEMAKQERPAIILLDIGLPGMDGCEVARRLKEIPFFKNTLLVAISGYGQEHDVQRSKDAGFNHHLVKPVDFDVLYEILQKDGTTALKAQESAAQHQPA